MPTTQDGSPIANQVAGSGSGFANTNSQGYDQGSNLNQGGQGLFGWSNNGFDVNGTPGQIPTQYSTTQNSNGSYIPTYTLPAGNQNFIYANPNAYQDPNAAAIYSTLAQGFNNSTTQAPTAKNTALGSLMMLNPTQLNTAPDQALAAGQNTNINQLYNTANGNGPSVAVQTAEQQRQANINAGMAMLASQRGPSAALGQRAAATAVQNANAQAAQQGVLGKTSEAMNAQNALTGALGGARTQGQNVASTAAQLQQGTALANQGVASTANLQQGTMNQQTSMQNLQAALQQGQINVQQYDQMVQAYLQQNQTDISNNVAYQQILANEQLGNEQISTGKTIGQQAQDTGLVGAGVSAIGALAAASDRNLKTNIVSADSMIYNFLNELREKEHAANV